MQIILEIPGMGDGDPFRTVAVDMDRPPNPGDQVVLVDATGSVAYRVRRQAWRIEVRREVFGEVSAHRVQLEPDIDPTPPKPRARTKPTV